MFDQEFSIKASRQSRTNDGRNFGRNSKAHDGGARLKNAPAKGREKQFKNQAFLKHLAESDWDDGDE